MGSELRRQLREALGPDIKGLQRAVALEIADDARWNDDWKFDPEKGRRSKARLADLVRWTAAKDELSVREMLRRLSVAGWEFRLPIGKDKRGLPLYAVPGKVLQFRVPDFKAPTTVGPAEEEGPTTVGPIGQEGPTTVEQGPTTVGEGPTVVGEGPTTVGQGPTTVGPFSPSSPPYSPKESPSTSPAAGPRSEPPDDEPETGGGGGDLSSQENDEKDDGPSGAAAAFVKTLDYRGKPPGEKRRTALARLVQAALAAGWTEDGLRRYLDISDDPSVRNAAAVYAHRLAEDELPQPSAEDPWLTGAQHLTGTDATVLGWAALAGRLGENEHLPSTWVPPARSDQRVQQAITAGRRVQAKANGHQPYKDTAWAEMRERGRLGIAPPGSDKHAHCGDAECDDTIRMREEDDENGLPTLYPCPKCHPALQF